MNSDTPVATNIGAGLVLDGDGDVGILLTLGESDENAPDGDHTIGAIVLNPLVATVLVDKLQTLLSEATMATEAVSTMGTEAAREYLNNWAKRINSQLN